MPGLNVESFLCRSRYKQKCELKNKVYEIGIMRRFNYNGMHTSIEVRRINDLLRTTE